MLYHSYVYYYDPVPSIIAFILLIGLAAIPASIARKKGRSFGLWYLFGFFFWLIALIVAICVSDKNDEAPVRRYDEVWPPNRTETPPVQPLPPPVGETATLAAHFPSRSGGEIECPVCRKRQMTNRDSCYSCGCKFVYDDETSIPL